jgi:hypothetical protein
MGSYSGIKDLSRPAPNGLSSAIDLADVQAIEHQNLLPCRSETGGQDHRSFSQDTSRDGAKKNTLVGKKPG